MTTEFFWQDETQVGYKECSKPKGDGLDLMREGGGGGGWKNDFYAVIFPGQSLAKTL